MSKEQSGRTSEEWRQGITRRTFGSTAVVAGVGLAGALTSSERTVRAATLTDADILNFALNLEYLEAEFYTKALTGQTIADYGIGTSGTGTEGPTLGGTHIAFDSNTERIMLEVADNERNHVQLLRAALGSAAISKPTINLDALGAFATLEEFLVLARAFEDVGVSAYGGAAMFIQDRNILEAAARIALTEAYHAGNIRLLIAQYGIPTQPVDAADRLPPPTGALFFSTTGTGLAKIRRPSEVLAIVYGSSAPATSSGGFFPDGVNGSLRTV